MRRNEERLVSSQKTKRAMRLPIRTVPSMDPMKRSIYAKNFPWSSRGSK
jgi:hypothetical protein